MEETREEGSVRELVGGVFFRPRSGRRGGEGVGGDAGKEGRGEGAEFLLLAVEVVDQEGEARVGRGGEEVGREHGEVEHGPVEKQVKAGNE